MCTCHKLFNLIRPAFIHILMAVFVTILIPQTNSASKETPVASKATLLVLDNCDSDNEHKTPPFGDAVFLLNSRGELVREIHKLTIDWNFGGSRAISASEDGRLFAVCENVANKLTVYETATCRELWSLSGEIESAVFANGLVYALNRENVFAIDNTGTIVKHSRIGGLDIVVDPNHDCLWIVGLDVKKCNLDLQLDFKVKLTLDITETGAFSVDVNPDGSIWVTEQNVYEKYGRTNRLVKRSPDGSILKTVDLNFSPLCVHMGGSDGSVWTTGVRRRRNFPKFDNDWPETLAELNDLIEIKTHTHKYDSEGKLLLNITQGGYSIDLDPSDGSVWIAGRKKIWHYSSTGTNLATYEDVSDSQKWLAVVPE